MGDVVNLNRYRKTVKRDAEARQAQQNRTKFGRDKTTREREKVEQQRLRKDIDDKKLE